MIVLLFAALPPQYRSKVEELYFKYKKVMLSVALDIVKDGDLACDIVHLAFIRIIKHIEKIDNIPSDERKGYLIYIVKNLAIDHLRKMKRENTVLYDNIDDTIQDSASSIEDIVMLDFEVGVVRQILRQMDDKYALPLILKYTLDFSQTEIADMLNISVENVKVRCHRGRKMLVKAIGKEAYHGE